MPILKVGIITRKTRHYKDGKFSSRPEGTGFYDNRNRKRVPEKIKSLINMNKSTTGL